MTLLTQLDRFDPFFVGFDRFFNRTSNGDGDVGLIKDYGGGTHDKPINYIGHSYSGNAS